MNGIAQGVTRVRSECDVATVWLSSELAGDGDQIRPKLAVKL